jgi:hypothetical protein
MNDLMLRLFVTLQTLTREEREEGQTAAEYVGVIALIVVIAAALVALSGTDIANAIKDGVVAGVKKVTTTVTGH